MRLTAALCLMGTALILTASPQAAALNYSCPSSCDTKPNCHCASDQIPGGLAPKDTPMFVVLTNDDAINPTTFPVITNITSRHQNKNGCQMPATWFVCEIYTQPSLVQQVFTLGHEIATHTVNHVADASVAEIVGARMWLNQTAGIPLEMLQGFRTPFLKFSPQHRAILEQNGFRYDSSITEPWDPKSATSPNASDMVWPYTMDYGIPQNCAISTGTCNDTERWPGLWEFPMWDVQSASGTVIASMDPLGNDVDNYKTMFDARYNGNRAPLGIFLHAGQLLAIPDHVDQVNQFLDYALGHEGVFLATVSQVLDWIGNPVPVSQYQPACPTAAERKALIGVKVCAEPDAGCMYGKFNNSTCSCDCENQSTNAPGYCPDTNGACSLAKTFDTSTNTYTCPGSNTAEFGSAGPASSTSASTAGPQPGMAPAATADVLGPAQCGHPLINYTGLAVSSDGSTSEAASQAVKAIDGSCTTCSQIATQADGTAFLTIQLNTTYQLSSVQLQSTSEQPKIDILVGNSAANSGLNNTACATGVVVGTNGSSSITVPCNATGSLVTLRASGGMTLCDVYPSGTPIPPAPAGPEASVMVEIDVNGLTVGEFTAPSANYSAGLCRQLVALTGDASATCAILSVAATNPSNRRRMLLSQVGVHVESQVNTTGAASLLSAFSTGPSAAAALQSAGLTIDPTTAKAYYANASHPTRTPVPSSASASTAPAAAAPPGSSGGGSSVAAIAGGVAAGLVVLAIGVAVLVIVKRRRAAAAQRVQLSGSSFNPAFDMGRAADATATVSVDGATAKAKLASNVEAEDAPLGSSIASFNQSQHP